MRRDIELVRELLLKLEALPMRRYGIVAIAPDQDEIAVEGFDADQIDYHLLQIRDAGLIDDGGVRPADGIGFRSLTPAGHDFLDSIRDPKIWKRTKRGAEAAGGFTIDLLKDLALGFVRKQVEDRTGVKL